MKYFKIFVNLTILLCVAVDSHGQQQGMVVMAILSEHTAFPDTARREGHRGDGVFYPYQGHYDSKRVLLIYPGKLHAIKGRVDMVFWFHGWHNNVDTAANYYQLIRQFRESHLNAVLVLPEAAKDAADSYGGKLEQEGMFKLLVEDVLHELTAKNPTAKGTRPGNILLGGHSGGGEVISFIVDKGGVDIKEVVLFDALYDGTDFFMNWLKRDVHHRFIHMDTDYGYGPKDEALRMMKLLGSTHIPYRYVDEEVIGTSRYPDNRVLFIHSKRPHNDIIFDPDHFKAVLEASPYLHKQ